MPRTHGRSLHSDATRKGSRLEKGLVVALSVQRVSRVERGHKERGDIKGRGGECSRVLKGTLFYFLSLAWLNYERRESKNERAL
jgi:hypothetical protein